MIRIRHLLESNSTLEHVEFNTRACRNFATLHVEFRNAACRISSETEILIVCRIFCCCEISQPCMSNFATPACRISQQKKFDTLWVFRFPTKIRHKKNSTPLDEFVNSVNHSAGVGDSEPAPRACAPVGHKSIWWVGGWRPGWGGVGVIGVA